MEISGFSELSTDLFDDWNKEERSSLNRPEVLNPSFSDRISQVEHNSLNRSQIYHGKIPTMMGKVSVQGGVSREDGSYLEVKWEKDFDQKSEDSNSQESASNDQQDTNESEKS